MNVLTYFNIFITVVYLYLMHIPVQRAAKRNIFGVGV
jgi:hypothetical protein